MTRTLTSASALRLTTTIGITIAVLLGNAFFTVWDENRTMSSSSRLETPNTKQLKGTQVVDERGRSNKLGDGCFHIYLDVGANIGMHTRFLFEPDLYPDATVANDIFTNVFGLASQRDNRDICSFGFEPNPIHQKRHMELAEAYQAMGWRYYPQMVAASDLDNGTMSFFHQSDESHEEWGFSEKDWGDEFSKEKVKVPVIRLAKFILEEIVDRTLPDNVYGNYTIPKVAMKMDIEGSEYSVLPDLTASGALCRGVDYAFGEVHPRFAPIVISPDEKTGRGGFILKTQRDANRYIDPFIEVFAKMRTADCKLHAFRLQDDESYLHDGMPFPKPPSSNQSSSA